MRLYSEETRAHQQIACLYQLLFAKGLVYSNARTVFCFLKEITVSMPSLLQFLSALKAEPALHSLRCALIVCFLETSSSMELSEQKSE